MSEHTRRQIVQEVSAGILATECTKPSPRFGSRPDLIPVRHGDRNHAAPHAGDSQ